MQNKNVWTFFSTPQRVLRTRYEIHGIGWCLRTSVPWRISCVPVKKNKVPFLQMRPIWSILCCIAGVHATCSAGVVCDTAYTDAVGNCCPWDALCVHCEHGVTRCARSPYTGCTRIRSHEPADDITFLLFLLVGVCAFSVCLLRSHYYHSPTAPVMHVVASPSVTDGFATGLIGGVLLSDALDDHSPEPEPPSYVEATFGPDV